MKSMRIVKRSLPKIMLAALTTILFVGDSVPAFAASDILANGYEEVYENTSHLFAEAQEVKMTFSTEGYEVNDRCV